MSIVKFSNFAAAILIGCLVIISSLTPTFAQSTDRDRESDRNSRSRCCS